jgi:hypothetical protein
MARDIQGATRSDLYTSDPELITLIWPKKTKEMGPRDLSLEEHPELHYYFAPDITDPLSEANIESMMMPLPAPSKGRVGVIQPIAAAFLEQDKEGTFEATINRPGAWIVACDGRTRTREAREANRRIRAGGGGDQDIIRIRFEVKPVDGVGAMLIRDIAQRCRKTERPLDQARKAAMHINQGTPKHLVLQAMGLKSWAQVENYAKLLTVDPKIQKLVDSYQMPMTEALSIGKSKSPAEQKELAERLESQIEAKKSTGPAPNKGPAKLTGREVASVVSGQDAGRPKPMKPRQIRQWAEALKNDKNADAQLALAVLNTVQGLGSMEAHPDVVPPKGRSKGKSKRSKQKGRAEE